MNRNGNILVLAGMAPLAISVSGCGGIHEKPNILFVIVDDQSWPYASAYGSRCVHTPGFDYVAEHGTLFTNAYVTSPGSSPSRASILTGLYPWQIEEAGTHASSFPSDYVCFPDVLSDNGYATGYTGKGWGPGNWEISGRPHNPAGPVFNGILLDPPYSGISKIDYSANFTAFLDSIGEETPFCFWLGGHEPHRPYENMSWIKAGDSLDTAEVPGFLPEADEVKSDILDYAVEIEWFDSHLVKCLDELDRRGMLDNTIIIVTADNGMSFPHAKANCYDAGIHVPLAACWADKWRNSEPEDHIVSSIDIFPTLLDAAGIEWTGRDRLQGESLTDLLEGHADIRKNEDIFAGRERHSCSRHGNLGYPVRCVRSGEWLLIRNFHPERWPAGDPLAFDRKGKTVTAYYDMDAAPSKDYLTDHRTEPGVKEYFEAAVGLRPEYELYCLTSDPDCMDNMAYDRECRTILDSLKTILDAKLRKTGDPRVGDDPEIWETYPRLEGKMREFPEN